MPISTDCRECKCLSGIICLDLRPRHHLTLPPSFPKVVKHLHVTQLRVNQISRLCEVLSSKFKRTRVNSYYILPMHGPTKEGRTITSQTDSLHNFGVPEIRVIQKGRLNIL